MQFKGAVWRKWIRLQVPGIEDVNTIIKAAQAIFVPSSMADPAGVGDIWPDCETEAGRHWRDKELRWAAKEYMGKDGYTSVASRLLAQLDLEQEEILSWGGTCTKIAIKEIELELGKTDSKESWEYKLANGETDSKESWEYKLANGEATEGRWLVYLDGSKLGNGGVGGG